MAAGTQMSSRHKIQRVPPLLLQLEKNKNDYLPEAVSLGPYHHGKAKLAFVEAFKPKAVDLFISGGPENKEFYYNKIHDIIGEIRSCYVQTSTDNYSDADLAQMMLDDASLIIIYMEITAQLPDDYSTGDKVYVMLEHLGMLTFVILWRDLILLDNQIPLRVIKLLINLRYGEGENEELLDRFMINSIFRKYREKPTSSPEAETKRGEPLHLLEAFHRLVVKAALPTCCSCTWLCCFAGVEEHKGAADDLEAGARPPPNNGLIRRLLKSFVCRKAENPDRLIHSFRTVKDLRANGIYFKPSPTQSLKDVNFRSHFFYATLELPEWYVSLYTKAFFKNLVAYELSPSNPTMWEVASYVNLMKSLIERPEDVKELRERKILFNQLGSDEELLNVYKDIDTHGCDNGEVFLSVKDRIEAHYNSLIQTWMAEIFHTNFRSPWTATAFLAAAALLAISVAQLYYAVHPPPN